MSHKSNRSVSVGGDAAGNVIQTGDHNTASYVTNAVSWLGDNWHKLLAVVGLTL